MVCTRSRSRSGGICILESGVDSVGSGGRRCGGDGKRLRHQKLRGSDWAEIGAELLEYIQKKLPSSDVLRCRGVCRWWRSVTKTHLASSLNHLLKPSPSSSPPLILWDKKIIPPVPKRSDKNLIPIPRNYSNNWCFFDILMGADGRRNLYFPSPQSEQLLAEMGRCVGSSSVGGYFLFVDKDKDKGDKHLFLFHPMLFSGSSIRLPLPTIPPSPQKFTDGCTFHISRAILWADPISGRRSCSGLVVTHPDHRLPLFAKCGAAQFTPLECRHLNDYFVSLICVKNSIYGITGHGSYYFNAWDCTACIGGGGTTTSDGDDVPRLVLEFKPEFTPSPPSQHRRFLHLVESDGDILLVVIDRPLRCVFEAVAGTGTILEYNKRRPLCEVYKMDFGNKKWVRVNSLGDRVLFVTHYQATSLSSREFPQYQGNSIYFYHCLADRYGQPSLGIFNMEDGSIKLINANR